MSATNFNKLYFRTFLSDELVTTMSISLCLQCKYKFEMKGASATKITQHMSFNLLTFLNNYAHNS